MGETYHQLTEEERIEIYAMKKAGNSQSLIAAHLGRDRSTISRELRRNSGRRGYRPKQAHAKARERLAKPRTFKMTPAVVEHIESKLALDYSPEQISHTMARDVGVSVSHETIYRHVWKDKRQNGSLYGALRLAGRGRRRKRRGGRENRGKIPNKISIDQRPAIVEGRGRVGDWEADLISGARHRGFLVSLVERKSRLTVLGHVQRKTAQAVGEEIIRLLGDFQDSVHTITFDNGLEFAGHQAIARALECDCYFAHPYCSCERATNENTNGLVRQYFPKNTDLRLIDPARIEHAQTRLNHRPRKVLGYKTPAESFAKT